jgi:hypothetical protein
MRYWGRVIAALAVAGCSGSVSNADRITNQQQSPSILASSVASDQAPPICSTLKWPDNESPAWDESQGHAQIRLCRTARLNRW